MLKFKYFKYLFLFVILNSLNTFLFAQSKELQESIKNLPIAKEIRKQESDWLLGEVKEKAIISKSENNKHIILSNGLVSREFTIGPNGATIALENLMTGESELRAVRPEAVITINNKEYNIGGLKGQEVQNFLTEDFISVMTSDPSDFQLQNVSFGETEERFAWKKNRDWLAKDLPWPSPGKRLVFKYIAPQNAPNDIKQLQVDVYYEIYDGLPIISKWIVIHNNGKNNVRLNHFNSEVLALVETAPKVAEGVPREYSIFGSENKPDKWTQMDAPRDYIDRFTQLFVVTDYAMGGDMEAMKDNPGVRWLFDHPEYGKNWNPLLWTI